MRDPMNVFESVEDKLIWGSQGQPVFPQDNKDLVTFEFRFFLAHLAFGIEEAQRISGQNASNLWKSQVNNTKWWL